MGNNHKAATSAATKTLIALVVLVVAAAIYLGIDRERIGRWYAGAIIEEEKAPLEERIAALERDLEGVRGELHGLSPEISDDRMDQVFGAPAIPESSADSDEAVCRELAERLDDFFSYLDTREYVIARGFDGGSRAHLGAALVRALTSPPVVERETDTLTRLFENSIHFFRVLGKDDVLLIRDILRNEGDVVEPAFALGYRVLETGRRCREYGLEFSIPLEGAYEYAAYFLGTLGGRSYLLRRSSRTRMLALYYAILVLNKANGREMNVHGLDIRAPIDSLIDEMDGSVSLVHRREYLKTLRETRTRYRVLYGG